MTQGPLSSDEVGLQCGPLDVHYVLVDDLWQRKALGLCEEAYKGREDIKEILSDLKQALEIAKDKDLQADARFFAAEIDGILVGLGSWQRRGEESYDLVNVMVLPAFRHRGISIGLVEKRLADLDKLIASRKPEVRLRAKPHEIFGRFGFEIGERYDDGSAEFVRKAR
jgi:GNAT superfamily N-acetyltransferase